ncbi:hypothetical protein [Variovorax sp. GT1P44]|uniref:hypothetical protein n=1 Tax=Variovorax sp. GT1P44 TaxID=3443742 RepID=UPI003F476BD6
MKKTVAKTHGSLKRAASSEVAPPRVSKAPPVATTTPIGPDTTDRSMLEAVKAKAKSKLVRDSFTMPEQDYDLIAVLKERALGFKRPAKKSEMLRAGLHALQQLTNAQLQGALDALTPLKVGRPKNRG